MARELGTHLADLVAEGDDVVEASPGGRVQPPRTLLGDVDAVLHRQDPDGNGVDPFPRVAAGTADLDRTVAVVPEQRLRYG